MYKKTGLTTFVIGVIWALSSSPAWADTPKDPAKPDCFVLSVGIDKYLQSPLNGCVNDARNMAQHFQEQKGKMFGQVAVTVLLDQQGNRARIGKELDRIKIAGKAGDFIVVFLSGHGGNANSGLWFFVPQDHGGQEVTKLLDTTLLQFADTLAGQGKKVLLIVDACFSGQLRVNAHNLLDKNYPKGGGLILMVSSMPSQTSAAMGRFSAFAQAVYEGLSGHADFNGDGYVTLREVRTYAYHRVHDMQKKGNQDGEIDYSLSISENLKLAKASKPAGDTLVKVPNTSPVVPTPPGPGNKIVKAPNNSSVIQVPTGAAAKLANTNWHGQEDLKGFGTLTFRFLPNNETIMQDKSGETPGTWNMAGNQVTLRFHNGRTVYTGNLQAGTLTGTAQSGGGQNWTWWAVAIR